MEEVTPEVTETQEVVETQDSVQGSESQSNAPSESSSTPSVEAVENAADSVLGTPEPANTLNTIDVSQIPDVLNPESCDNPSGEVESCTAGDSCCQNKT